MRRNEEVRERATRVVREAQDSICAALEAVDGGRFVSDRWERPGGGGGVTRILSDGAVFAKAGVNVSVVHGALPPEAAQAMHGLSAAPEAGAPFFATGVSLVLHPHSPMVPTAHANYRYFELGTEAAPAAWWFGGGSDLTPYYLFEEDARHFHEVLAAACRRHDAAFYPRFKRWCDEYFHLPHRGEARGVGGLFFDRLCDRDPDALLAFVTDCAAAFVPSYVPIVERRRDVPWGDDEARWQQLRRGRYVEFNLLYDRGTLFGLRTGGRIESILMSLPPLVRWDYANQPAPGSREAALLEVLRSPREWAASPPARS